MLAVEDVLCELAGGEDINEQGLPPGFRFHPTDEELITYYLASKVFNGTFCGVDIAEVDLNRCEPWELPEGAKMGEREWYFFSLRDRKYPTGLRTNRATGAGYWKATGKDREVYSSSSSSASNASASASALLGMKKTLVFYKGRAPRGEKTKWVMHEYRLDGDFSYRHTCKEEWVICRIFHKTMEKKKNPIFQGQSYFLEASSSPPTNNSSSCLTPTALLELECPQSHHPTMQMQMQMKSLHHQQNPFLMIQQQEEDDLKSIINPPIVSQNNLFPININGFQLPSFSPTPTTIKTSSRSTTSTATTITSTNKNSKDTENNIPSSAASMLFKSLLSHQQQQANNSIPKQCKTEASFSHFQLPDASANLHWVDKIHHQHHHQQQQQNPSSFQYHHHHHHNNNNNNNPSTLFFEMDCNTSVFHQAVDQSNTSVHEMSTSIAAAFNNRTDFQMILDPPIIKLPGESWPLNP